MHLIFKVVLVYFYIQYFVEKHVTSSYQVWKQVCHLKMGINSSCKMHYSTKITYKYHHV